MLPDIWGKHLWFSIHFIAQDYPKTPTHDEMIAYKDFFDNLWKVIPCYKCGVNYKRHLQELPIDDHLGSREDLFAWTVELHNIVNRELGKPIMTLDEAKKKYSDPEFNKVDVKQQQIIMPGFEYVKEPEKNYFALKITCTVLSVIAIIIILLFFKKKYIKYK